MLLIDAPMFATVGSLFPRPGRGDPGGAVAQTAGDGATKLATYEAAQPGLKRCETLMTH
jgi:hypothetical protein